MAKIAFQGFPGAYSDMACRAMYPDMETLPSASFEDAFQAMESGAADYAMIPVDNTLAGRVADVHHLLPRGGNYIVGEYFLPIRHALLGVKGAKIDGLQHVHSHIHALPQCRKFIARHKLKAHVASDTAGAAAFVAKEGDPSRAAIASALTADIYGLDILETNIQDEDHNTTRFLVFSRQQQTPAYDENGRYITSILFRVRNIPAALFKAMGGFATNGINMTKLESYVGAQFKAAQFYCDVEGHPDSPAFAHAWEEMQFFASETRILGTYTAHEFRHKE